MSALALRIIACLTMLLDHIGYLYGITPLRIIGRISFPLFLFLICNGYRHTSNRLMYALRLGIFAALSQVPFSLFTNGSHLISKGNVLVTLLICLLCIWLADIMDKNRLLRRLSLLPMIAVIYLYSTGLLQSDYGIKAILMITVFYLFDRNTASDKVLTVIGMAISMYYSFLLACGSQLLKLLQGGQAVLPTIGRWDVLQGFGLLSLIFIFSYNGNRGLSCKTKAGAKVMQYGFYAFYPLHMLLLWALNTYL